MRYYSDTEDTVDELRLEAQAERRYRNRLLRHPDCGDPDHPGCPACSEHFDEDEGWDD
jgi:hypothetical protein